MIDNKLQLTDQQRAIVEHFEGPALVFAVAGSGKTTSMVHRISRLVNHHHVTPSAILATSFNAAAAQEIRQQLAEIGVGEGVDCRTLHSLGYKIIQGAIRRNLLSAEWLRRQNQSDGQDRLINRVLTTMSIERGEDLSELGIDREELKNSISAWKGNLVYPDPERAGLPLEALEIATKAAHGNRIYVEAYQRFEDLRREEFLLTFDDMLMMAWELLVGHPELLAVVQDRYQFIMVDEFQDVNRAQYEIIDLISRPHRNYMAIGDDDQCIYEWRGADPTFILEFEKTYDARVYTINDNFRSTLHQVALANAVIAKNRRRYVKVLSLTRGLQGKATWNEFADEMSVAENIASRIKQLLKEGAGFEDFVILIRLYSQTAFLETAFIENNLPYFIEGAEPFYRRQEIVTLLQYLSFAKQEQEIREGGFPASQQAGQKYVGLFRAIVNRPRRYLSRDYVTFVCQQATKKRKSLLAVMENEQEQLRGRSVNSMLDFVHTIRRLQRKLKKSASKSLGWLDQEIGYREYLLEISGHRETGITRVQTVGALIRFAATRGTCIEFLDYIREISIRPVIPEPGEAIRVMTIYRAKGLEWPTVFVPGCSTGILPCALNDKDSGGDIELDVEAERRLFYVAITRARKYLHLFHAREREKSRFVEETRLPALMKSVADFQHFWEKHGVPHSEKPLTEFCRYVGKFALERYFEKWVQPPLKLGKQRTITLQRLAEAAELTDTVNKPETTQGEKKSVDHLQKADLVVRRLKSTMFVAQPGDSLYFDSYADGEVVAMSERGLIGVVDLTALQAYPVDQVRWTSCQASVVRISDDARQVIAAFEHLAVKAEAKSIPDNKSANSKIDEEETRRGLAFLLRINNKENKSGRISSST